MSRNKKPALRRPCESKNHLEIFTTSGNGAIHLVPGLKSDSTDFRNSGKLWKELRTRPHSEGFCWREMWCCKGPFHSEGRGGGGAARRLTVCICVCVCFTWSTGLVKVSNLTRFLSVDLSHDDASLLSVVNLWSKKACCHNRCVKNLTCLESFKWCTAIDCGVKGFPLKGRKNWSVEGGFSTSRTALSCRLVGKIKY